jgi:hypothetical protein
MVREGACVVDLCFLFSHVSRVGIIGAIGVLLAWNASKSVGWPGCSLRGYGLIRFGGCLALLVSSWPPCSSAFARAHSVRVLANKTKTPDRRRLPKVAVYRIFSFAF